jgi:hypothetical protein
MIETFYSEAPLSLNLNGLVPILIPIMVLLMVCFQCLEGNLETDANNSNLG